MLHPVSIAISSIIFFGLGYISARVPLSHITNFISELATATNKVRVGRYDI